MTSSNHNKPTETDRIERMLAPRWAVPTLLAALTVCFYWKVLFTNRVMFPWDVADFFYPSFSFVHEELRHFRLPLWNPYSMSGFPIIGDPEAQIFYPLNWLFVLLHPAGPLPYRLVELQVMVHFFLAGLFLYYLARDLTGSRFASLLAGVLFQFSGAMVAHTQHVASVNSMAWYPAIFLLARRGLQQGNYVHCLSAGMLFGIQALAGHWQHAAYLGMLLFLYFAYEAVLGPQRRALWPRWLAMLLVIAGVGAALAMIQVIPTQELGSRSVRAHLTNADVTDGNLPSFLLTLFLPNYFGGLNGVPRWTEAQWSFHYVFLTVPGCLLALIGIVETLRRRNFFWLALILFCIELSLGRNGRLAPVLYHVPVYNLFRNAGTFFDVANFGLCLMAAIGAGALVSGRDAPLYRKYLPLALLAVLALAAAVVLGLPAFAAISGRYHLLAVLAAASFLIAAAVRRRLSLPAVQLGLFALALFQIFHYSMNQPFNWSLSDPRTYQSFATAVHDGATLKQLRSDPATDFRFAAFAESPWSGNGSSVWRIPAVFGWNPITLQRYERYVREFIHTSEYTLPYGGPDHDLSSPMLDLLGVKYVVVSGPEWAKELGLPDSGKFERVAGGSDWWQLYRNPDYISRAWFYPAGYVVRGEEVAMGLMKSRWFQARHTLVLEEDAVGTVPPRRLERLPSLRLRPEDVTAASTGGVAEDPDCSERTLLFGEWVGAGNWIRFDFDLSLAPGNYVLLIRYNAAVPEPAPVLAVSARNGSQEQRLAPAVLGRTYGWRCMETRTAELGVLRLVSGPTRLVLTSAGAARVNLYAAWLVRLPDAPPPLAGPFSFADFQYSANRISLTANLSQDGFVLLNEIEYPGWEARLDGQPAPILRANGIFRALYVPAGSHRIEMRFRPRRFLWGAAISMATLAGYAGLVWLVRRKRTQTRGKIEVPSG